MRQLITTFGVCAAIGFVISVSLAWTFALLSPVRISGMISTSHSALELATTTVASGGEVSEPVVGLAGTHFVGRGCSVDILLERHIHGRTIDERKLVRVRGGWPWPVVSLSGELPRHPPAKVVSIEGSVWSAGIAYSKLPTMSLGTWTVSRRIPIRPTPALMASAMVWGAPFFLVYLAAWLARRFVRGVGERCRECGYAYGELDVCPECGHPTDANRRMSSQEETCAESC